MITVIRNDVYLLEENIELKSDVIEINMFSAEEFKLRTDTKVDLGSWDVEGKSI